MKYLGKVIWFNNKKGFGFIKSNNLKSDMFVHFSDILQSGFKILQKNQLVEFEIGENYHQQPKAVAVKII